MKEIGENNTNITEILKRVNLKEKIPEATLRFNARKLKELGLIKFGDKFNKGKVAELTPLGLFFYEILENGFKSSGSVLFLKSRKINKGKND
jgi:predicted transcriptional regulator